MSERRDSDDLVGSWFEISGVEVDDKQLAQSVFLVQSDTPSLELGESIITRTCVKFAVLSRENETNYNSGTVFITNFRILLVSDERQAQLSIPLHSILEVIEGKQAMPGTSTYLFTIELRCIPFRAVSIGIAYDRTECRVYQMLKDLQGPNALDAYQFLFSSSQRSFDGWSVFSPEEEYKRLGLFQPTQRNFPWRITEVNHDYSICSSYPAKFIVPSRVSDLAIRQISQFRSRGRIPAIVYKYPQTNAILSRCSQPRVGLCGQRCRFDEDLFVQLSQSTPDEQLYVIDCRDSVSALGNKAKGMGCESQLVYSNIVYEYMNLRNIHKIKSSFQRLFEICYRPPTQWLSALEYTEWLDNISAIITASVRVSTLLKQGKSVVVHCSDGWDRTSQVVSLAEIMLDPYYRTIRGFQVLIEKEWCSFGHCFSSRCGFKRSRPVWTIDEWSPIFLQFMDTVYQLYHQFPTHFEFNEEFLVNIIEKLYSGAYGTFFGDSEQERHMINCESTVSIWTDMILNEHKHRNRQYCRRTHGTITPSTRISNMKFWSYFYLKGFEPSIEARHEDQHEVEVREEEECKSRIQYLEQKVENFCTEINQLNGKKELFERVVTETPGVFVEDRGDTVILTQVECHQSDPYSRDLHSKNESKHADCDGSLIDARLVDTDVRIIPVCETHFGGSCNKSKCKAHQIDSLCNQREAASC